MIKAALVIAAPLALTACANSPLGKVKQAQTGYEQSVADYRACLAANPNNPAACNSKREAMEAEEHLWADLRCATFGGGPMCNIVSANVTVDSRSNAQQPNQVAGVIAASSNGQQFGQTVYNASECVGPVIMGVCHGSILPNQATHPTCYGQMLNGQCTGPMF
jgi:hypothetical protein